MATFVQIEMLQRFSKTICHVSIRQMSTHMPGFQSFSSFFVLRILSIPYFIRLQKVPVSGLSV